jgi:hypothetical protein
MPTSSNSVDLAKLFGTVANTLAENKDSLNSADDYNHDHGDNMVQTFETITQAMKAKKNAAPADQLAYASELLRQKQSSGSSKLYADGLSDASVSLAGQKSINSGNAMQLVQSLLGAGQQAPAQSSGGGTADLLGSLLGGLTGAQTSQAPSELTGAGAGDLIGSLLGGLGGNSSSTTGQQSGIDMNDLINAGMSFMQAKEQGSSNLEAIINAVVGSSRMNTSAAHTQSGTLVANTLMQVLGKVLNK